jgi:hypothetical protein
MKNRRKLNRVAFERGHAVQTFAIDGTGRRACTMHDVRPCKLPGQRRRTRRQLRERQQGHSEEVSVGSHRQPIRSTFAPRGCANVSQEPFDSSPVA